MLCYLTFLYHDVWFHVSGLEYVKVCSSVIFNWFRHESVRRYLSVMFEYVMCLLIPFLSSSSLHRGACAYGCQLSN